MANLIGGALVNQVKASDDSYFDVQKAQLVQRVVQQGMDPSQIQAFLDQIGAGENDLDMIIRASQIPNYSNRLRFTQPVF